MILSIHLSEVRPLRVPLLIRRRPRPADSPGLRWADLLTPAPLGKGAPRPNFGHAALVAAWDNDAALDYFLGNGAFASELAEGWSIRMQPLRAYGSWSALPDFPKGPAAHSDDEPVAVLTLGRVKLGRFPAFLRAQGPAAEEADHNRAAVFSTAFARPPLVSTFSLWESASAMKAYAYGDGNTNHMAAVRADQQRPFHHESIFARFRPYAEQGSWQGQTPLKTAMS